MTLLNMNDTVRVKLTVHGHEALIAQHKKLWFGARILQPYKPPQQDEEGWSEWQLWELMRTFGPHIGMGFAILFENNTIEFVRK